MSKKREVFLETIPVIIRIPKDTVSLKLKPTIMFHGEMVKAEIKLSEEEVKDARRDFVAFVGDDDYDAELVLTEETKRRLGIKEDDAE